MLNLDPEILQDFMTESGELLDQLESDLVELERAPADLELINGVFRALHTIKGSASFLSLTNLVKIAHAAEGALNSARNRVVNVDRAMMDLLLQAVDLLKLQFRQLAQGQELAAPPEALVAALTTLAEGRQPDRAGGAAPRPATGAAGASAGSASASSGDAITLEGNKADLLDYFITDLEQTVTELSTQAPLLRTAEGRPAAAGRVAELSDALGKSVAFFEFDPVIAMVRALSSVGDNVATLDDQSVMQLVPRVEAILRLLAESAQGLKQKRLVRPAISTLIERTESVLQGRELPSEAMLGDHAGAPEALSADGVTGPAPAAASTPASESAEPAAAAATNAPDKDGSAKKAAAGQAEATIRVEVGRLETLMNLVGELVLQKNRISALSRSLGKSQDDNDSPEAMLLAAGGLDRITGEIQVAVMRTRMQPLEKLFGKYPRLIRDLARKTGKKIDLVIEGGDTEVDKSMIEELADPLVHLLRNSADHGIEPSADRIAAGKSESGTIRLTASHKGSHVEVRVIDDGRGLHREKIIKKAVERGLAASAEQAAALSDREVFNFIFLPGFSTADQVSDLSGRGVGMDVVRTNIEKLKGAITLDSKAGSGTTLTITIPLTVAILPAMMVGVGAEVYAVPLSNVLEIVKPRQDQISSIGCHPVMRLRDIVLPLVRADDLFDKPTGEPVERLFAVVLTMNDKRVGLLVSRLIGQQEIVVKALEGVGLQSGGAASGATVRDDGGVSLIVDVAELIRRAEGAHAVAA